MCSMLCTMRLTECSASSTSMAIVITGLLHCASSSGYHSVRLLQLAEQLDRIGALAGLERGLAADSEGRDQLEQFTELIRGSIIEAAVGAARSLGDLAEDALDRRGLAFLEHEDGRVELTELLSEGHDLVRILLERIAHEDYDCDLEQAGLALGVSEDLADLC